MLFPTLSLARSCQNLAIFEYTPGGSGLNYDETLYGKYHNFRIISFYLIMVFSLIFHFSIGMLLERYGSFPELIRSMTRKFYSRVEEE